MTVRPSTWSDVGSGDTAREVSFYQRAYRQATHPRYGVIYGIVLLWTGFFLWMNNWQATLATLVLGKLAALASVWTSDTARWFDSPYGRLIRLHYHPANLVLHTLGLVGLGYGLWQHEAVWILAGLSVAATGHLWGWRRGPERVT